MMTNTISHFHIDGSRVYSHCQRNHVALFHFNSTDRALNIGPTNIVTYDNEASNTLINSGIRLCLYV